MNKTYILAILVFFSFKLFPMTGILSDQTDRSNFFVSEDKEEIKNKFRRLRRLLHLEQFIKTNWQKNRKDVLAEDEELCKEYKELDNEFGALIGDARTKLWRIFWISVTDTKIDAYLEATHTNPNSLLDWNFPSEDNDSLLTHLTYFAINQQHVYINAPCPASVIEALLNRGGNPNLRPNANRLSALEIAESLAEEKEGKVREYQKKVANLKEKKCHTQKNNTEEIERIDPRRINMAEAKRELREYQRVCDCAKEITALFKKHNLSQNNQN